MSSEGRSGTARNRGSLRCGAVMLPSYDREIPLLCCLTCEAQQHALHGPAARLIVRQEGGPSAARLNWGANASARRQCVRGMLLERLVRWPDEAQPRESEAKEV